jgi:succinyl-CoA synthetase beta subunit
MRKPIVVKLLGNSQEEAWRILEDAGVTVVKVPQTEVAVEELAMMLRG